MKKNIRHTLFSSILIATIFIGWFQNPALAQPVPLWSKPGWGYMLNASQVAISPDGRLSAYTSNVGKYCHIVENSTGNRVRTLTDTLYDSRLNHDFSNASFMDIKFSPDSRMVAYQIYYNVGRIRIVNPYTGSIVQSFTPPTESSVYGFTFSPDGKRIAAIADQSIMEWEIESGKLTQYFPSIFSVGLDSTVSLINYSPDGKILATGARSARVIRVINLQNRTISTFKITTEPSTLFDVAFSENGQQLIVMSKFSLISYWNPQTGKNLKNVVLPDLNSSYSVIATNRRIAATVSSNNALTLWDLSTGEHIKDRLLYCKDPLAFARVFAIDSNANHAVTFMQYAEKIQFFRLQDESPGKKLTSIENPVNSGIWNNTIGVSTTSVAGAIGRTFTQWNLNSGEVEQSTESLQYKARGRPFLSVSPTGKKFVISETYDENARLHMFNGLGADIKQLLDTVQFTVNAAQWSADGKYIILLGSTEPQEMTELRSYNTETGSEIARFTQYDDGILAFASDIRIGLGSDRIVTSGKFMGVFSVPSLQLLYKAAAPKYNDGIAQIAPDGTILTFGMRGWTRLSYEPELDTIQQVKLSGYDSKVQAYSISPDTRFCAFAVQGDGDRYNGKIIVWNVATGQKVGEYGNGTLDVFVEFTTDNRRLVTCNDDMTITVWDIEQATSVIDENLPEKKIETHTIVPNPATNEIEILGAITAPVEVFSSVGLSVLTIENGVRKVDVSQLPSGVYYARIPTVTGVVVKSFVIIR